MQSVYKINSKEELEVLLEKCKKNGYKWGDFSDPHDYEKVYSFDFPFLIIIRDEKIYYSKRFNNNAKYDIVTVETNIGTMPVEDFLHFVATQHGFVDYEEMKKEGLFIDVKRAV